MDAARQHDAPGRFFHVDDFAGLGGGVHGLLAPIQGTKSMWCGVRPNANDKYVCNWADAPGYGNNWDQNLEAGINVICAFNGQHLESLKDLVERVTGVVVRERVPDSFLKQADQVVNLDLAAEDLLERLRTGKIYDRQKIEWALAHFFREENL